MVFLRDVLLQPAFPDGTAGFYTLPGAGKPTLSQKNWVAGYREVTRFTLLIDPDQGQIDGLFGNEDALVDHLLNKDVSPLNGTVEWLQSEGDSVRTFYTNVSLPIQLAFQTPHGTPFIVQRSESGPLGPTDVTQTIDFTWGWGEHCLMIGELKRHGIIDFERWTNRLDPDSNRIRLGKELRGYCHKYKCFAASVFDGQHLLILVFHAQTAQQIRADCQITCLLFSSNCPTLRYGLFRTVIYQIQRMQAATAPSVILDGYTRGFRWLSWQTFWSDGNQEHDQHPNGYIRMFDNSCGAWYWAYADRNGTAVLDQNGGVVWDTGSLGL